MDGGGLRQVRLIENTYIELSDGVRCAAKIWLPQDAETHPVPAIIEMVPYRKRDGTVFRDVRMHPYIAARGYACIRVDIRGSGESEGLLLDEYLPREQQDGLEIIDWAVRQPWCTGAVGMTGISWGGFNALQIAAHRPPALKAIITVGSTDDRYADDIHYMGGCLISENPAWSADRFTGGALPPDPQLVGERWRDMWLERLEAHRPWLETWLAHQPRDDYWKQGSVIEDHAAITCAVYAVGGWEDSYSNTVPRLLAGLSCPRKGLIGPWTHVYPHFGQPGPAIGYLQEALRWWDFWLKGIDTGIMDEPMYRVWMLEPKSPHPWFAEHPGRWVAEDRWPSERIPGQLLYLDDHRLVGGKPGGNETLQIRSPLITGADSGRWGGYGGEDPDLPIDQRAEDGRSLCFDTPPLESDLEILGAPEVVLMLAADRPAANLAVRLCDVAPDGVSALITYGLLNLTHRDSHEFPSPLEPGRAYEVRVKMNDIARRIPQGHRLRLALATAHWPIAWPAPEDATLSVFTGNSWMVLPVRPRRQADATLRPFDPPAMPAPLAYRETRPGRGWREISDDVGSGLRTIVIGKDYGAGETIDLGIEDDAALVETYQIQVSDPLSARCRIEGHAGYASGGVRCRIETVTELAARKTTFDLDCRIEAYEDGKLIFARSFSKSIPRNFM
jgi:putative CocE/NonD family hydrolase